MQVRSGKAGTRVQAEQDHQAARADAPRLWLAWAHYPRNRGMSRALGVPLEEMRSRRRGWARYVDLGVRTTRRVWRFRGRDLFVTNPSLALALLAWGLCRLSGKRLIVDAHSAGLEPFGGRRPVLQALAGFAARRADLVIVTNAGSAALVRRMGGRAAIMPDPLPDLDPGGRTSALVRAGECNVLFICSWADDEPYLEVIEAARRLGPGYRIIITGDHRKRAIDPATTPDQVALAGFVDEAEYVALLAACDLVMDLTTRDDCMVCGAYETVAVGTPGILSDKPVNRRYFDEGFVYARNDAAGIAEAIREASTRSEVLRAGIVRLRERLAPRDREHAAAIHAALARSSVAP